MGFVKPHVSRKAVIYVRVSLHDQKQGSGLERQKQSLLGYGLRSHKYERVVEGVKQLIAE
jgi:predicted site-specific integrase-resolvase